jgi:beta-lactam-binding protein with PASTA domain
VLFQLVMRKALPLAAILVLAGCGGTAQPKRVPDLRGQRLDLAEDRLDARGLDWEEIGGGTLGIVIRSHWWVCDQQPAPGTFGVTVKLVVERECANPPFRPTVVPNVIGESLEDAGEDLDALGIAHDAETYDGDLPVAEQLWEVCDQDPAWGERASYVELRVARDCD